MTKARITAGFFLSTYPQGLSPEMVLDRSEIRRQEIEHCTESRTSTSHHEREDRDLTHREIRVEHRNDRNCECRYECHEGTPEIFFYFFVHIFLYLFLQRGDHARQKTNKGLVVADCFLYILRVDPCEERHGVYT